MPDPAVYRFNVPGEPGTRLMTTPRSRPQAKANSDRSGTLATDLHHQCRRADIQTSTSGTTDEHSGVREAFDQFLQGRDDLVFGDLGSPELEVQGELVVRRPEVKAESLRTSWTLLVVLHLPYIIASQTGTLDLINHLG